MKYMQKYVGVADTTDAEYSFCRNQISNMKILLVHFLGMSQVVLKHI